MEDEQQPDRHGCFFEQDGCQRVFNDLIGRINGSPDEVRLSQADRLILSYGIRLLKLELMNELTPTLEITLGSDRRKGAEESIYSADL